MESIEKKEIRPLFIKGRIAVYVYCYSYKGTRQLSKFGDVVYTSQKSNYSLLYVNNENLSDLLSKLKDLKFVKKVRVGHIKELDQNFSEAFAQTNLAVKEEIERL
ncbi:YlbG family protein [Lactococcus lactis]|uniref:YlbG family protein n=1 Tax=Lactococcus lactis TaxID=1358 RepID=UPI0020742F4C|nr:YlbG family protein [Lactococcus lactis]MCM6845945.1 YlbG family protein [Lactococcus lactis]MDN6093871.1 YlbG family protein [Lactococcus lactis]MDN6184299.1 YlbG family protein [Lactococcus lactis]